MNAKNLFAIFLFLLCPSVLHAAEAVNVAVAANFMVPFQEIAAAFEEEAKITVQGTYSSTGSLYAQIINGAPYDVFLSADERAPRSLFEQGLSGKPVLYASGRVVLWGTGNLCGAKNWREALRKTGSQKIALANPATAPYGAAAEAALKKSGLLRETESRLVMAQNVGQSFQYAVTGGTAGSFCALSSALSVEGAKGCHYVIEEAPPIRQSACLLKRAAGKSAALRFFEFLHSPRAEKIKKRYGYL